MQNSFDFVTIEKKWQAYWLAKKSFFAYNKSKKKKIYLLDMFPYPSGSGLHMGHCLGYVATDILARYHHAKGYNVLRPMGFDAFGLPAEQYAIETGQHPAITTEKNIARYKEQLKALGMAIDWSREISTADPTYYTWTQWIFLQLFHSWYNQTTQRAEQVKDLKNIFSEKGNAHIQAACHQATPIFTAQAWNNFSHEEQEEILHHYRLAFLSKRTVNWCPALGTVLANSEVKNGVSERGGYAVIRKKMKQWSLRTTAYADRLLHDLKALAWPDAIKITQKNWIGRSRGANIYFAIHKFETLNITVFTTRPHTIFGVTYLALHPHHPLIDELVTQAEQNLHIAKPPMDADVSQKFKLILESKDHHTTSNLLHDLRDKIKNYIKKTEQYTQNHKKNITGLFTGLYALHPFTDQKLPIWISNYVIEDYGSGAIMGVPAHSMQDHAFAKHVNLPMLAVIKHPIDHDLNKAPYEYEDKESTLINSYFLNGTSTTEAKLLIIDQLEKINKGKVQVNYHLQNAVFSRQRYWGEPIPITYQENIPCALNTADLPLTLPDIDNYKPTQEGKSPLMRAKNWQTPSGARIETDTMPSWAGSSWYFLRYINPDNKQIFVSREDLDYWGAVDFYMGGGEHATGHLIYARFLTKFLYDRGFINLQEPFTKLLNQGMIQSVSYFVYRIKNTNQFVSHGLKQSYDTTPIRVSMHLVKKSILDREAFKKWRKEFANATFILEHDHYLCGTEVEKMSKSKHNTIQPNQIIDLYGADTLRLYLMFLGPITQSKPWRSEGIQGVHRFLQKIWNLFHTHQGSFYIHDQAPHPKELKALHQAIKQVQESIDRYAFNTAISAMMICINTLTSLNCHKKAIMQDFLRLLAPFAPHMSEELWSLMGHKESILLAGFPAYNSDYLTASHYNYPIAINGKVRTQITLPVSASEKEIEQKAIENEIAKKWLQHHPPKKIIVVKGRMINLMI